MAAAFVFCRALFIAQVALRRDVFQQFADAYIQHPAKPRRRSQAGPGNLVFLSETYTMRNFALGFLQAGSEAVPGEGAGSEWLRSSGPACEDLVHADDLPVISHPTGFVKPAGTARRCQNAHTAGSGRICQALFLGQNPAD
ncbi:MAG TPA: hypothetical protein H9915_10150 [Candidatus Gemmiger faecigallinarum]|nr:hypothetical protein [Candidatus Gemmiger faecigallinarum]